MEPAPRQRRGDNIDWRAVRERLARAAAAMDEALNSSPQRAKRILDERARALARPPAQAPRPADSIDVTTFTLGNERYAIETRYVREIVRLSNVTPVPGTPDFVVGITNVRGEMVAVFDVRRFLGIRSDGAAGASSALILGAERAELSFIAEAVHEIASLPVADLRSYTVEPQCTFVRGASKDALIVLDGVKLLNDGRLFVSQNEM